MDSPTPVELSVLHIHLRNPLATLPAMWLPSGLLCPLVLFSLFSLCLSQSITTDVFYWPASAPEPSTLARISYDSTSASLKPELLSYSPPRVSDVELESQIVRVGLYTSTPSNPKQWVGTLTTLAALRETRSPIIQLHLGPSNEVYHVSLIPSSVSVAESSSESPGVELLPIKAGPRPHLNRPVVVGPDGTNTDEPVEKTFIQK